jgi:hypothetical protein
MEIQIHSTVFDRMLKELCPQEWRRKQLRSLKIAENLKFRPSAEDFKEWSIHHENFDKYMWSKSHIVKRKISTEGRLSTEEELSVLFDIPPYRNLMALK